MWDSARLTRNAMAQSGLFSLSLSPRPASKSVEKQVSDNSNIFEKRHRNHPHESKGRAQTRYSTIISPCLVDHDLSNRSGIRSAVATSEAWYSPAAASFVLWCVSVLSGIDERSTLSLSGTSPLREAVPDNRPDMPYRQPRLATRIIGAKT